jgi:hypothetical protein
MVNLNMGFRITDQGFEKNKITNVKLQSKATHCFELAACERSAEAQSSYADCILVRDGVETDKGQAER